MALRALIPRIALAALVVLVSGGPTAAELIFHPPATRAEQALDAVLHRTDADPDPLDNLLAGRDRAAFRPKIDYRTMLTAALLEAITAAERQAVRRTCGGRYRSGEVCGLDFVPITCAQDSGSSYLYRTDQATPAMVVNARRWSGTENPANEDDFYRLVRYHGSWLLDGICCASGIGFNMAAPKLQPAQ